MIQGLNLNYSQTLSVFDALYQYGESLRIFEYRSKEGAIGYTFKDPKTKERNIYINREVVKDSVFGMILLHELSHNTYGHLDLDVDKEHGDLRDLAQKSYGVDVKGYEHQIMNIAEDIEINTIELTFSNYVLLEKEVGILTHDTYPGALPAKPFRYYYDFILKDFKENPPKYCDGSKNAKFIDISELPEGLQEEIKASAREITEEINETTKKEAKISDDEEGSDKNLGEVFSNPDKGVGKGDSTTKGQKIVEIEKVNLKEFLEAFYINKPRTLLDSLKIYNRQSRGTTNLMYSSTKRKRGRVEDVLMIMLDVSSSMNRELLSSIMQYFKTIRYQYNPNSRIITWNTKLVEDLKFSQVDKEFQISGGTDLAKGARWVMNTYFPDKFILISDYEDNMNSLNQVIKEMGSKTKVYGLCVDNDSPDLSSLVNFEKTYVLDRSKK